MQASSIVAAACLALLPALAQAGATLPGGITFGSIDGGQIALDSFAGQPILVVNTASMCGYAPQFTGLQALYDRFRNQELVVLAVPSDDFDQELGTESEVKSYCELTYGIDMPMTSITPVLGDGAHPLFRWLAQSEGFVPGWNFNKVLIGADGSVLGTWGSAIRPDSGAILTAVETALPN